MHHLSLLLLIICRLEFFETDALRLLFTRMSLLPCFVRLGVGGIAMQMVDEIVVGTGIKGELNDRCPVIN